MKKKFKILFVGLLILGLMFAVVGCGGGESDQPDEEANNVDETVVYTVGTEPTFPPFEMTNDEGEMIGFDIDLIKAIAAEEGFEVEIQNFGFDALIPALQAGNIDIAASGMSITPARMETVDFSDPYIDASLKIAVTADNEDIASVEDLEGKTCAVQLGTTGAEKAYTLQEEGLLTDVKTFKTVDVVFMELINGGVDCVINDSPVTAAYMAKNEGKIKMVGDPLVSDSYGFAVAKDNTELLQKLNSGLEKVKNSEKFDELLKEYF